MKDFDLKIKKAEGFYPVLEINKILKDLNIDLVFYPDEGALKRYSNIYGFIIPYCSATKVRDHLTGNITSMHVSTDETHLHAKRILMVDDICDGGQTFIMLANEFKRKGALEVNLFVTHGIFSKGTEVLKKAGISRIFTSKGEIS